MISELLKDVKLVIKSFNKIKVSKRYLFTISFILVCSNITSFAVPILFGNIINGIVNKSLHSIIKSLSLMCLIYLFSTLLNYVYKMLLIKLRYQIESSMKGRIFEHILNLSYSKFLRFDKGMLMNNVESDSTVFSQLIVANLGIIVSLLNIAISLILMLYISPILTFLAMLTIPVSTITYIITGKKIKAIDTEYKAKYDNYISFLNESFYGWKFLNLFNSKSKRSIDFKDNINNLFNLSIKKFKTQTLSEVLIDIVSFTVNIANISLAVYLIFNNKISLGMFTAFNEYSETFKNTSISLTSLNSIIQETAVSISRVDAITDCKDSLDQDNAETLILNQRIHSININDLSYQVNGTKLFSNINIKFEKENIYLIKGSSGIGKTTFLNIICGLIHEYTGDIKVNEKFMNDLAVNEYRKKVCYITQDNYLFSLSIKENISMYRDIPDYKIENVCKLLNIHDKILSLPDKYNTLININGNDLSGGEKQRICIARAIACEPEVYVFDEITSSIDKENIQDIIKLIEDISKNSIIIMTSHHDLEFSVPTREIFMSDGTINYTDNIMPSY
ncbi:MAG: ABC transporter ATP-binding protein [Paraclostridium sp.]